MKFIFNEIKIKYENNEEENIIGNWKIEKDISNETNKRESIIYDLVKSNVEGVKVTKAITSNSVTKIELETKWNKPIYNDTDDEVEKNKKIESKEEVINNSEEKIIDKPAPEPIKSNSEEEKLFDTRNISTDPNVNEIIHSNMVDFENFKIKDDKEKIDNENKEESKNNDGDGGYTQSPEGYFFYHQTFNMSDVDSTNIVKVILPLNGELREYFDVEQILLELVKK